MERNAAIRWLGCVALAASLGPGSLGCYSYAVAARGPGPQYDQLPFDKDRPESSTQWRFLWGLSNEPVWSPLTCKDGQTDPGKCSQGTDPCGGNGIALYRTEMTWYTEGLTLVTLGIVSPVHVTYYCSTYSAARPGPH